MSDFERAVAFVLAHEGGYVNNPQDPGGETNWGISKRSYPDLDIRNLTRARAVEVYRRDYWEASGASNLPYPWALALFDFAIHSGVLTARNKMRGCSTVEAFIAARLEYLARLPTFPTFGVGWTRRVADLLADIHSQPYTLDLPLVNIYRGDTVTAIHPEKATMGWTNEGRMKLMLRVQEEGVFQALGFVIRFLPLIMVAIKTIEAVASPTTTGAEKKKAVTDALVVAIGKLGMTVGPEQMGLISQAIDIVVFIFNLVGVFTHRGDTPEEEPAAPALPETPRVAEKQEVSPNEARLDELQDLLID